MKRVSKNTSGYQNHPLLKVWAGILSRCYTPSSSQYYRYGAVGVRVCDEWRNNFKSFYDWCIANGWQKKLQIDKDIIAKKLEIPALLYSPETCCIVTPKENCNNRSSNTLIEYKGEIKTLRQWADLLSIHRCTLSTRLKRMNIEKAFTMPVDINNRIKAPIKIRCIETGEEFVSIIQAAKTKDIKPQHISRVLQTKRQTHGFHFEYLN